MAPLDFGFLQRPTTYIPLLVAASINFLTLESVATDPDYERSSLDGGDLFYANALSFGAGVGEEALFRGWLLPALQHYTGNSMVSNGGAATLFALAHYPVVQRPVFQLIMGAYWGYLTQSNRWSIRESIFIHTWWDVMAFLTIYQIENKKLAKIPNIEQLTLRLPPLRFSF